MKFLVLPVKPSDHFRDYDLFIGSLGYESRATYIAQLLHKYVRKSIAPGFTDRKILAYDDNVEIFRSLEIESPLIEDEAFQDFVEKCLNQFDLDKNVLRIAVDISSMNRTRIAMVVSAILGTSQRENLNIDFFYAPSKFHRSSPVTQIKHIGPVLDQYVGYGDPTIPITAIIGLGFESEAALGVLEDLEPSNVIAYLGLSKEGRYFKRVLEMNKILLNGIKKDQVLTYRVDRPYDTFTLLYSSALGLQGESKIVFVPFGSKVFALCSLLVASSLGENIGVWRASPGSSVDPVDQKPTGEVYMLRVVRGQGVDHREDIGEFLDQNFAPLQQGG